MDNFLAKYGQLIAAVLTLIATVIAAIWGANHFKKKKLDKQKNTINTNINANQSINNFTGANFGVQNKEVHIGNEHKKVD